MVKEKCCSIRRVAYWFLFIWNQNINPDLTCDMSDVYPVSCEHLNQLRKSWMTRFGVTNALLCVAERNAGMLNHKGYGKFLTMFLSHWNLWRIDYTDWAQIRLHEMSMCLFTSACPRPHISADTNDKRHAVMIYAHTWEWMFRYSFTFRLRHEYWLYLFPGIMY